MDYEGGREEGEGMPPPPGREMKSGGQAGVRLEEDEEEGGGKKKRKGQDGEREKKYHVSRSESTSKPYLL